MDLKARIPRGVTQLLEPIKDLLQRLTAAQRLSLGILGAVLVVGLVTLVAVTPAEARMVTVPIPPTPEFKQLLVDSGIEHDVSDAGKLMVRRDSYDLLYERAFSTGYSDKDPDFMDWILSEMSFSDTVDRTNKKVQYSVRRNMQRILENIPSVKEATVFVNKKDSRIGLRDSMSTATVQLVLEPGVERLPPHVARTAAKMVAAAWTIPVNRVVLSDHLGRSYSMEEQEAIAAEGRQGREREMREKLAGAVFDGVYAPNQFSLIVDLRVDRTTKEERQKVYDPDGTVNVLSSEFKEKSESIVPASMGPGVKPNVAQPFGASGSLNGDTNVYTRDENRYNNNVGEKETRTTRPAGEEVEWHILAKVSKTAIVQFLHENKKIMGVDDWSPDPDELEREIDRELKSLQAQLESFPTAGCTAVVSTFIPPPPIVPEDIGALKGLVGFAGMHIRELVLATLALVACFLLYRIATSGLPELEELPDPVAELSAFLGEKEKADRRVEEEKARAEAEKQEEWEVGRTEQAEIELLQQVSDYAENRPDVAAAVIRLWLSERDPEAEGDRDVEEEGQPA